MKAREVAERLIRKIALETMTLAELRCTVEMPEPDWTATDAADDAISVMLGDDIGCLDPDDEEDAQKIARFLNECTAEVAAYAASERSRLAEKAERDELAKLICDTWLKWEGSGFVGNIWDLEAEAVAAWLREQA